jgi:simple sugar transport system permease protein
VSVDTVEPTTSAAPPGPAPSTRWRDTLTVVALYAVCILGALMLSALVVRVTGGEPSKVFTALLDGSLRRPGRWGKTLTEATPLLLVALGTTISYRAGLVNIGQEGQLLVGAAAAAFTAIRFEVSGPFGIVVALAAGIGAGALWAGVAAGLRYWRSVPEVLSTLLLVYVAGSVAGYLLTRKFLLLDPDQGTGNTLTKTGSVPHDTRLPRVRIFGNDFPISVLIALVSAVLLWAAFERTVWGFRLRMLGLNPRTARRAGVSAVAYGGTALVLSGAFAGLAGSGMLLGGAGSYQFTPGFANGIGWQGLLVALVARNNPLGAIAAALVFGGLRTGSTFLASSGVGSTIVDIIQAHLVLAMLIPPALLFLRQRRRALAAIRSRT